MNAPHPLHVLHPVERQQGRELPHESARLHVTGEAVYIDDIPELRGTLYAALILSPVAHGELLGEGIDREAILREHGVVAVFTAADIPGENNCGPIIHDDPFLADGKVEFLGQPVAVVVAREMLYAREAARKARVAVQELPAILSIDEAMAHQSFVMPAKLITRGKPAEAIAAAPHRVKGRTTCGQQEQFYLEGQIAYAVPREDGQLTIYVSTQHPDGNQREAAAALNLHTHDIEVICRRMGGGFGGKEGNSSIFSQSAALAAFKLNRPVKLRANRDDDMTITGKRHDFRIDYEAGFDDEGRILGLDVVLASRCGYSTDYSGPVNDRAILHIDNCYYLPNLHIVGHRCKTNMQSATAFRGFGGPQGMFGIETVIEDIAHQLGKDPLDVRRINLYQDPALSGDPGSLTTQYNQPIEDWIGDKVIDQLEAESGYHARREQVNAFNQTSRHRKKGLALVPLKFGISFTATMLNQGGALVHIYQDGSVSVNHGGTEMGQGLNTKMAQVAADGLGIPVEYVRVTGTDTQKVPNASATAASSGADINGAAINNACDQLRERLKPVAARLLKCEPDAVEFIAGYAHAKGADPASGNDTRVPWPQVVKHAWLDRVGLSVTGFYMTPDIAYDFQSLQGRAFYYFCYGAAVTEVEIDTRTGEWWLQAVDIVHDVGRSINPAIDKGQIEGAYIQGMGWLTMEECIWDRNGKLLTHGPSTYKIPVAGDIPEHFKVSLFDGENVKPTPYRSKAVGEPPLMLALSAFFAVRDAVSASAGHKVPVDLVAPATPERILLACERARAALA
ncbi:MAG: xanthine dehydrogenase molybdopterin binding subunit [Comamonadaceae bacterium]|jgi:xanthine dehydrogenase large subunit|uniref:xanthine dehydrogenase molybdopterin binding subunit n=1 Tax=Candidatus Skiveiella danica TaxID=3386177 RepID=UPI001B5D8368|nr:xanthine dehydrogenase molybdopterin binding subunit [Comamonadaceae bacterium]MBK9987336.1 xanthine dehydrogenase molybdopterin binding subunit [Betaproteobacteria bacterium]MBP8102197.1 xanthine dehydrogenase molybdopterin binding subunit [Burkholderiaceae bacterium]MBK6558077.1 xanthine dehydrogenase molybdopterin binding subunit [Comamonadaceae bacterium]MBK7991153.1 xanthine dehydrogenase molybdopterin binding subunit [Comamonadaceae bacterium]